MIDKGICDKGFIWNPSSCEWECDKLCDVGEYLDYKNCRWRKRLIDKLVEECNENIDGNEMTYNGTLNAIPLNDCEKMQFLYNIHCIISNIFHNKYKH